MQSGTSIAQKTNAVNQSVNASVSSPDKNPFKFIEQALTEAKQKIAKMQQTPQILESLPDVSCLSRLITVCEQNDKKKKYLKAENKLLRENLKRMSENVNILIEKMNQEQARKQRSLHGGNQS